MHKLNVITQLSRDATIQHLRKFTTQQWQQPLGHDTGIKVYSCVQREKVPLILPNENYATWYTCGPTVYDSTHLGHASCYVKLDIIQRILRQHFGINLVTAMNVTDIDDKIIAKALESGQHWQDIAKTYETEFWADLRKLNVTEPNLKIRVTENIPKIIAFIENIMQKKQAYVGKDNSVYFNVNSFQRYGKLQKLNIDAATTVELLNKCASADFALWKARKTSSEPAWDSPWGAGRPGWHIECSALATHIFGHCIDFHAGGLDLKFPHHENEEAQSCVFHGTDQWINYWLHTGQLNVKGQVEKMSKSLKNTISIDHMLASYSADQFRMACVLSNYRNAVEYSPELLETAANTLQKFKTFHTDCRAYLDGKKTGTVFDANAILQHIKQATINVDACFKNDFDTARSISVLLDVITNVSRYINAPNGRDIIETTAPDVIAAADNFVQNALSNFGFQFSELRTNSVEAGFSHEQVDVSALLEDILKSRTMIRDKAMTMKSKELFQICDDLRNCLQQHGIEIKDHNQGSSWSYSTNKK